MECIDDIDIRLKQLNILVHIFTNQTAELKTDIYNVNDLDFKVTESMATAFTNMVSTQKQQIVTPGFTPLMFAIRCKNNDAVHLLLNHPDNHAASNLQKNIQEPMAKKLHPSIWKPMPGK